jgi:hypothetical protein
MVEVVQVVAVIDQVAVAALQVMPVKKLVEQELQLPLLVQMLFMPQAVMVKMLQVVAALLFLVKTQLLTQVMVLRVRLVGIPQVLVAVGLQV